MALARVVLDTDILSAILRRNPLVLPKAQAYLAEHGQFTLSILTRY
jgi:tRNA(fMet)-specific endonuclease VapC